MEARVRIELRKLIPVGAGLGGGSSDAGAVLRALAAFFPGALDPERLPALAAALGADVPFFLDPRPARVHGIGERIEPLAGMPSLAVVVATPAPPLATAEVFRAFDALTPAERSRRMPALPDAFCDPLDLDRKDLLANDLEPVAARLRPGVRRLRAEIERAGARTVGMSGSGPSVFGIFTDSQAARSAADGGHWEPSDRIHVGRTLGSV
jgi:4-diphosphocytidyl-2-C-methyl-D-erythritol kinase